jgi:hypothetical protein
VLVKKGVPMIKNIKKALTTIGAALATCAFVVGTANATPSYSLFGDASEIHPGNNSDTAIQLVSDADPGYGGIDFTIPTNLTFADLNTLSTDFNVTDDDCAAGSPRFQIEVSTPTGPKNIFVYLGDAPNYTGCVPNTWISSGDLLESGLTIDTSQLAGGAFYDSYADALAEFGTYPITSISLVVDSGYASGGEQTVLIDNTQINGSVITFEALVATNKDQCKKDGWKTFGIYKNQGDCVSAVSTNGRNQPSGIINQ